jgi:hypothetical protein
MTTRDLSGRQFLENPALALAAALRAAFAPARTLTTVTGSG